MRPPDGGTDARTDKVSPNITFAEILRMARREVREIYPPIHGGEVMELRTDSLRSGGLLDFSANINPLGPSPKALKTLKAAVRKVSFYPDSEARLLRESIARRTVGVGLRNLVVGNGSTEIIYLFTEAFVGRGDEALAPIPTFGEYERAVQRFGGRFKGVMMGEGFSVDPEAVLGAVGRRTRIIFLCNPNNPTATLIARRALMEIVKGAADLGVLVFLDEDCMSFVDEEKRFSLIGEVHRYPNLFILRSFSKLYGLPGLRVGYGVAEKAVVDLLMRAKMPWNVNLLAQVAAAAALDDDDYIAEALRVVKEERMFLLRELADIAGLKVFPSEANFILVDVKASGLTSTQLKEKMLREGILIRDCSTFRGLNRNFIRVTVRRHRDNLMLLGALKRVLRRTKTGGR